MIWWAYSHPTFVALWLFVAALFTLGVNHP
jgi:hypothetical protein